MSRTSYTLNWRRRDPKHRPDFATAAGYAETYDDENGQPLFTVITHGGPTEGIFTLIAEAPRLRDELTAHPQPFNEGALTENFGPGWTGGDC